jgi:hypothetical protein
MKSIRKTTLVLLAGGLTFFRRASARGLQMKAAAVFIGSVLCLSAPGRASADPIVLDFEGLSGMTFFSGNPIPAASQLSDQFLTTFGVRFSSGSPYVAVVNLGLGHATSGINGIGGSTPGGILTYAPANPIIAEFFDPFNPTQPATTDFVSLRIDLLGGSGLFVTLEAFDVDGNLLASQTLPDIGGATLQVAAQGIHSVRYLGTADEGGAAVDDFTFNPVTPTTITVVAIDIKPGSDPNSINPRSRGTISVAILTAGSFDATTVDPTTVLFGATGTEAAPVHFALRDVDGDGDTDMILHFNTQATRIQCGDTSASLTGETFSGQMIQGSDSVKTVGCK